MEPNNIKPAQSKIRKNYFLIFSVVFSLAVVALSIFSKDKLGKSTPENEANLEGVVLSESEAIIPVKWGSLGRELVASGVIDAKKFEALYASRGGMSDEMKSLLYEENNGNLKITKENSGLILNLLWALGLGNKNEILEKGPMMNPEYGGAGNFASTGGWNISVGDAMTHYSKHEFFKLSEEQQKLVAEVSKNIYRPCCGNSTYFPDCNHGMAMLALLELMASQGVSEKDMYAFALSVNSFWFPDTYLTIAKYLESKNIPWGNANPKTILGIEFSSAMGFQKILQEVKPQSISGSSCGA